ncbi:MAG: hypothetical protein Q9169_007736, partial [Polycauliona sp. 2 TL-2023]
VRTSVIHDFNIGSYARFHRPEVVLSIHDRPDFLGLSHLELRLRLDEENKDGPFIVIDETTTLESHAVWFVVSTEESHDWNQIQAHISYPEEAFTLWQLRIMTQQLPFEWHIYDDLGLSLTEDLGLSPDEKYDPHDPQEPPFGSNDWDKKPVHDYVLDVPVIANPGEWLWTDNVTITHSVPGFVARAVTRLTAEAAKEAGLIAVWNGWNDAEDPDPEQRIDLYQKFDWDSPLWPWDGVTGGRNRFQLTPPGRKSGGYCQKSYVSPRRRPTSNVLQRQRQRLSNVTKTA